MPRLIKLIVIHCSASPNGESLFDGRLEAGNLITPVQRIDAWHKARGFKRDPQWRRAFNPGLRAIGYHFVIYTNGAISTGRAVDEIGAHVAGKNSISLGVCLVGTDKFTAEQWAGLKANIESLTKKYPEARVVGHRDLSPDKDGDGVVEPEEWTKVCPCFDVSAWLTGGMAPLAGHLLEAAP